MIGNIRCNPYNQIEIELMSAKDTQDISPNILNRLYKLYMQKITKLNNNVGKEVYISDAEILKEYEPNKPNHIANLIEKKTAIKDYKYTEEERSILQNYNEFEKNAKIIRTVDPELKQYYFAKKSDFNILGELTLEQQQKERIKTQLSDALKELSMQISEYDKNSEKRKEILADLKKIHDQQTERAQQILNNYKKHTEDNEDIKTHDLDKFYEYNLRNPRDLGPKNKSYASGIALALSYYTNAGSICTDQTCKVGFYGKVPEKNYAVIMGFFDTLFLMGVTTPPTFQPEFAAEHAYTIFEHMQTAREIATEAVDKTKKDKHDDYTQLLECLTIALAYQTLNKHKKENEKKILTFYTGGKYGKAGIHILELIHLDPNMLINILTTDTNNTGLKQAGNKYIKTLQKELLDYNKLFNYVSPIDNGTYVASDANILQKTQSLNKWYFKTIVDNLPIHPAAIAIIGIFAMGGLGWIIAAVKLSFKPLLWIMPRWMVTAPGWLTEIISHLPSLLSVQFTSMFLLYIIAVMLICIPSPTKLLDGGYFCQWGRLGKNTNTRLQNTLEQVLKKISEICTVYKDGDKEGQHEEKLINLATFFLKFSTIGNNAEVKTALEKAMINISPKATKKIIDAATKKISPQQSSFFNILVTKPWARISFVIKSIYNTIKDSLLTAKTRLFEFISPEQSTTPANTTTTPANANGLTVPQPATLPAPTTNTTTPNDPTPTNTP